MRERGFQQAVPTRKAPLSMNHQTKPKLKNSKTQISEFMSFGLFRPLNRKKPFLISHDFGIPGSWSQCAVVKSWRLSMNRREGARHSCRFITRIPSDVEAA